MLKQESAKPQTFITPAVRKDPIVKGAKMPDEIQQIIFDLAYQALQRFSIEKEIAAFIKKELEARFGSKWFCRVGRTLGGYMPILDDFEYYLYFQFYFKADTYMGILTFEVLKPKSA